MISHSPMRKVALAATLIATSSFVSGNTVERPRVAGYYHQGHLFKDPMDIAKRVCEPTGAKSWTVLYEDPPDAGTEAHPDVTVVCQFNWGRNYTFISWKVGCPGGFAVYSVPLAYMLPVCSAHTDKPPQTCNTHGNPIDFATRNKISRETDYSGPGDLNFTRLYFSIWSGNASWGHNYSRSISVHRHMEPQGSPPEYYWDGKRWLPDALEPIYMTDYVWLGRPGEVLYFRSPAGVQVWSADSDIKYKLSTPVDPATGRILEFRLTTPENDVEVYSHSRLERIEYRSGRTLSLAYSDASTPAEIAPEAGLLLSVTDDFGRSLKLTYDAQSRRSKLIDPASKEFSYAYDSLGNLESVTYPEGNKRVYLYNEPANNPLWNQTAYQHLLTGIADEIAPGQLARYSTYKYDGNGHPISTEQANGIGKYVMDYGSSAVTDPLGTKRTYGFTKVNGVTVRTGASQPSGAGCGPATAKTTYTPHGEVFEQTDFNGTITRYEYVPGRAGLEKKRTVAVGRPEQRIISTNWHATLRLPLSIAEPKRITSYEYDAKGNVLSETLQATTDLTGALGFAAATSGTARKRSFAYNSHGKVVLEKGPRTDVLEETRYAYDPATGNLTSITNALNHVTLLSDYDAHGRVGRVQSPDGTTTSYFYTSRGWLDRQTVTDGAVSRTTRYTYDGVGKVKQITLPGGVTINYSYDNARRLTGISDTLGNSITYNLDAMGNRKSEETRDPSGTLARHVTREFDALNRLQKQTGATQ